MTKNCELAPSPAAHQIRNASSSLFHHEATLETTHVEFQTTRQNRTTRAATIRADAETSGQQWYDLDSGARGLSVPLTSVGVVHDAHMQQIRKVRGRTPHSSKNPPLESCPSGGAPQPCICVQGLNGLADVTPRSGTPVRSSSRDSALWPSGTSMCPTGTHCARLHEDGRSIARALQTRND